MKFRHTKISILMALAAAGLLLLNGCSSDNGTPPPPFDVEENLAKAWGHFASSDYDEGLDVFSEILEHSHSEAEAYLGKGWCLAFEAELDSALVCLRTAIKYDVRNEYKSDANMGLAAVTRDYLDYPDNFKEAVDRAKAVIEADSNYVFSKRTSIDYMDAHLIIAQCYFRRGVEYYPPPFAHSTVNYLCDVAGLDSLPDPDQPGISADEYERMLADKLEALTELIGD